MKKLAILTMDDLSGYVCDDHLLSEPFKNTGWETEDVPWKTVDVEWDNYDAVIIRSPWDYMKDPDHFLKVLQTIDESSAHLENCLDLVKWNIEKTYLRELEHKSIPCIPTLWLNNFDTAQSSEFHRNLDTNEIIIKPVVSAGAIDTYRLTKEKLAESASDLTKTFANRTFMVQPFIEEIISSGEYSLFYFGGELSHTILKVPKEGDFRVQEEYGGILQPVTPSLKLADLGKQVLEALPFSPFYARVDLVPLYSHYALIEVELIEPSLYLRLDEGAPQRFANSFDAWIS